MAIMTFRETYLLPAVRGYLDGTLESARQQGITDSYRFPAPHLAAHLVEWFDLPVAEAQRLVMQELSRGMCVRGWRFALSAYYQDGQRQVFAQRLHS